MDRTERALTEGRIFHHECFAYDVVEAVLHGGCAGGTAEFKLGLSSGRQLRLALRVVAEGVFRLQAGWDGMDFQARSAMLLPFPEAAPWAFAETEEEFLYTSGPYTLAVTKKPFNLALRDAAGVTLWELELEEVAGTYITPPLGFRKSAAGEFPFLSFRLHGDERLFGLGEKWNKVEKTGTRATVWAADTAGTNTLDLSYKSVPVLFSTRGWGLMLHSSYRSYWEIGSFSYTSASFLVEDDKLDLFLFAAPTLKGLLERYTALTGRPSVPPKWALGVWMSRCAYQSRAEVEGVLARLREKEIPCDVIHLDPPWMKKHYYHKIGVDACDFAWSEEGFPDRRGMFREFKTKGFATCLWLNPYLPEGEPIYEEAKARGYLVKTPAGEPARLEFGERAGLVDFTNPAAKRWWQEHLRELIRDGASVFKADYGERVPEEAVFWNGKTGAEMHNLYPFLYSEAVYEVVEEETGVGIVWRRSGYIGSQRYPGTWAGDTQTTWEAMRTCLRGGLSAGLTGEAFWSCDIGGFCGPQPAPELYIRWAQLGMFCGLTRFHGTTPREPWEYGPEAEEIVTRYARLRYRLIPYLLAAAGEAARTGLPLMRHMALEFPDEPNVDTLDDQYMLGPDLLVAPVMLPGARTRHVYFPRGVWTELENPARTIGGPGFHRVTATLARLPLFVREGAVLPKLAGNPQHLKGGPARELEVDVYPGRGERTVSFVDDGLPVGIVVRQFDGRLILHVDPAPLKMQVNLLRFAAAEVNGDLSGGRWGPAGEGTWIEAPVNEGLAIEVKGRYI